MRDWLYIPLDDRPCCRQFPQRLASLEMPPQQLLGKFQQAGDGDALLDWLEERASGAPGAIVSVDMLVWGGLVASRHPSGDLKRALARLERLWEIRQRHDLKLLAFQTIMRNAPTQRTAEEVEWAEAIVEFSQDPENEVLRSAIPSQVLHDYMRVRQRNLRIYRELAQHEWESDYLVFALDDSKTSGWNLLELESLGEVNSLPGTDETGLLLVCRALAKERVIQVDWSHAELQQLQGLYEDRPAGAVLKAQMAAADLGEGSSDHQLWLYGRAGQSQIEARAQQFAEVDPRWLDHLSTALEAGARIVLVDLTFANGGDLSLGQALRSRGLWPKLAGYSAWNTLGNRVGCGLATLVLNASREFLAERLADDLLYQADFRWRAAKLLGHPGLTLSGQEVERVEDEIFPALRERVKAYLPAHCEFRLPWERLFEVECESRFE
ncbi:MAG: DUF4127 family protein [Candidatus Eremiobacteraeota bacterium]|nr:DUF4127 family protein [Candidatus Eremiobacteraeota bacterium]